MYNWRMKKLVRLKNPRKIKTKKIKIKKPEVVVPKYLPLRRSEREMFVDGIFFYASLVVITAALTLLFITLLAS